MVDGLLSDDGWLYALLHVLIRRYGGSVLVQNMSVRYFGVPGARLVFGFVSLYDGPYCTLYMFMVLCWMSKDKDSLRSLQQ
jgi:hypothetical protein